VSNLKDTSNRNN